MDVTVQTEPHYNDPEKVVYVQMAFHWESKEQFMNSAGGIINLMWLIGESVRKGVKKGVYSVEGSFTDEIANIIEHHPEGAEFSQWYGEKYYSNLIDFPKEAEKNETEEPVEFQEK